MIVSFRPIWLLHVVLAFAAMVRVLRADTSMGDRVAPSVRVTMAGEITSSRTVQALATNNDAPLDRALSRLASGIRATWQRDSRRPHRTATSPLTGAERAPGTAFGATPARRVGAPLSSRLHRVRRDDRRRAAPTRAPPNDC